MRVGPSLFEDVGCLPSRHLLTIDRTAFPGACGTPRIGCDLSSIVCRDRHSLEMTLANSGPIPLMPSNIVAGSVRAALSCGRTAPRSASTALICSISNSRPPSSRRSWALMCRGRSRPSPCGVPSQCDRQTHCQYRARHCPTRRWISRLGLHGEGQRNSYHLRSYHPLLPAAAIALLTVGPNF